MLAKINAFLRIPIKILYLLVSQFFEIPGVYEFLGFFNKRFGFIKSVFMCYAGSPKYGKYYAFPGTDQIIKWRSSPIGIFKQGDNWGLALGSLMTEKDFMNPTNKEKLERAINRIEHIAKALGVEKISLAGVLPSYLEKQGRPLPGWSNYGPAKAVVAAYENLCKQQFNSEIIPVILLGGSGNLGLEVSKLLKTNNVPFDIVDIKNNISTLPETLQGQTCILIDVSRRNVLKRYLDQLWPEITLLNETFPEPSKAITRQLNNKGIQAFHLAGVKGRCYPTLPYGYKDSIPCCAMLNTEQNVEPIIAKMRA